MMDPDASFTEVDLKQERFEDVKEEAKKYNCDLCDKEMVHKVALVLLEGLSTACVDNTTGDIFKSPGTVAAEIRKEMLDYLSERSESFVAESLLSEEGPQEEKPDQPSEIISDLLEDFAGLKRNILSRVSGWLLSDMREDKIDDFVQEMELNSFWLLDRREAIAQIFLKNIDFKNEFHCNMKFKSEEEVEQHRPHCGFRTVLCENEGCCATFSAAQMEQHDSVCPFKILPCEQKCPEILMRREMDRHCITVCPMKLVNCPFYSIGCQASVPSCNIKEHCLDDIRSHLLYSLQYLHKGASVEDLAPRADKIEQELSAGLTGTQSVRYFTKTVKDLDSKLGPFEVVNNQVDDEEGAKKLNSERLSSDGKNNLDYEQLPVEDTKKSELDLIPARDLKEPHVEQPTTEEKKSDSEQPLPKDPKNYELSAVYSTMTDTEQPTVENVKSEPELPPAEDVERPNDEQQATEDKKKSNSEQPSPKAPKRYEPSAVYSTIADTEQCTVENLSELELHPAGDLKKLDAVQPATEDTEKSDTEQPTVENVKSEPELPVAEDVKRPNDEQQATEDEKKSNPEQPSPKAPKRYEPSPKAPKRYEPSAVYSTIADTEQCTVENLSELKLLPAGDLKKLNAVQPATEDTEKSDTEQPAVENVKSEPELPPAEDVKRPNDEQQATEDEKKLNSEQPSPKAPKRYEPSAVYSTIADTEQCTAENLSELELHPAGDSKKLDDVQPATEDTEKSDSEQLSLKGPKKYEPPAAYTLMSDTEQFTVKTLESELELPSSGHVKKLDSEPPAMDDKESTDYSQPPAADPELTKLVFSG